MKTELVKKILEGNVLAASRLMRGVEDEVPEALEELSSIYSHTGKAYIVGVTGAPGVGKSSLIDSLISNFRSRNMTVGVVAVDPTSPFTGGAILGDRIRMQRHCADEGVFIRSLATRGWGGGLAKATLGVIHILDAMGKDIVLVETVGSGQSEIDVTRISDTSIVVLIPELGDTIQMMKAGILEAADIFVINKADKDGANNLKTELEIMLSMRGSSPEKWHPNVIMTKAIYNTGIDDLVDEILRHKQYLFSSKELEKRRKQRAEEELIVAIESSLRSYIRNKIDKPSLEKLVDRLVLRETDPHSTARKIINQSIK